MNIFTCKQFIFTQAAIGRFYALFAFFLLFSNQSAFAQAINNQIKDVVMPSPNAASLGKYGDIPVSYNTGVPSIGIPIHTITEGSISLPISLSYHAGGLKVGEPCSWVGTGWSLQAGGIISRTIQGRADERENGYFSMGHLVHTSTDGRCIQKGYANTSTPNENTDFHSKLQDGQMDGEPDIFSFSVGGYNGKFYIDAKTNSATVAGKVILITQQDVKITYNVVAGFGEKALDKFTILTPDGVKYEFGNVDGESAIEVSRPFNNYSLRYASSWYLRKITSADGKNALSLNYVAETYQYSARTLVSMNTIQTPMGGYYQSPVDMFGYRLSTITTPTETVRFVTGAAREDIKHTLQLTNPVPAAEIAKVLSAIEITKGTTTCKRFELSQTYFEDASSIKSGQHTDKRLRLNTVQEKSCMGTADVVLPPHVFNYYGKTNDENYLPNTLSSAVDHWGYYNDATANPRSGTNIPYTRLKYHFMGVSTFQDVNQGTSNRETDEDKMKWGTIKQITYPTGGNTTFDYEANTYWDTEGVKSAQTVGVIQRMWSDGNCYTDPAPQGVTNFSSLPTPATGASVTIAAFTANELANAVYVMEKETLKAYISCGIPTSTGFLRVYVCNAETGQGVGYKEFNGATSGSLITTFTNLQPNVSYKFAIYGMNFAGRFTIKKEITILQNVNKKVGGLRIKKITNHNGISIASDVIKTYTYDTLNTLTNTMRSSGLLYQNPVYGYVYQGYLLNCSGGNPNSDFYYENGFFIENALVPLASFEGNHLTYPVVRENYMVNNAVKYYTLYRYTNEAVEPFSGIPTAPIQPRIASGQLARKEQWNEAAVKVASEENTGYADPYDDYSYGKFIKFNTYSQGLAGGNPISFWKKYTIRNRPYRLAQTVSIVDMVSSTTTYGYNSNSFLAPTDVTTTNSEGSTQNVKTYYAANMPPTHPNYGIKSTFIDKFMILVPLQQEVYVNGTKRGGSVLEYKTYATTDEFYPYKSYSMNRDGSLKLGVTVDAYTNGLPTQMTKTGYWISQNYAWDSQKRLTGKTFNQFDWGFTYKGTSDLVEQTKDENSFKNTFEYDNLMRLTTSRSYFADIPTNTLRSTTTNIYNYGGTAGATNNYIENSTQFEGIANPLSTRQVVDGLGRPIHTIKKDYNGSGQHVSNYVTYDALGRQDRVYKPFVTSTFGYLAAPPTGTPYTYMQYEASPLSRPLRQYAEDNTFKAMAYGTNTADEVLKFTVITDAAYDNTVSADGFYAANELYKTVITDENGKETQVFKDKLGKVLLTRKTLNNDNVDTYNVYDDWGSLIMVIPPDVFINGTDIDKNLVFRYKYDLKNRLTEKQIPGADPQRFYYDNRDFVTLTQDGNMREADKDKYMATIYDEYGRPAKIGFIVTTDPSVKATSVQYSDMDDDNTVIENSYWQNQAHLKSMPPNSNVWAIGKLESTDLRKMYRSKQYNAKGEFEWTCPEYINGHNCSDAIYNSAGKPIQQVSYNNFKLPNNGLYQMFYTQQFTYDQNLRPTKTRQQLWGPNGSASTYYGDWHNLSEVSYNHLDQVTEKNIGRKESGGTALQSIDYQYNTRGWLTAINNVNIYGGNGNGDEKKSIFTSGSTGKGTLKDLALSPFIRKALADAVVPYTRANALELSPLNDNNPDLFSEKIDYETPDSRTGGTPQYNGNISAVTWQVAGRDKQAYGFKYDGLDRLTEATYFDVQDDYGITQWNSIYSTDNKFKENVQYDLRGNITSLQRNGLLSGDWTTNKYVAGDFGQIDDLVYAYNKQNQVTSIEDNAEELTKDKGFKGDHSVGDEAYVYDKNGNMIEDKYKKIHITYNYLNLPLQIEYKSGENNFIHFVYSATGEKLQKIVTVEGKVQSKTDYINGIEYKNDVLQRIAHTEGSLSRQDDDKFLQEYVLRDHLGNTRVTFTDADNDGLVNEKDIRLVVS